MSNYIDRCKFGQSESVGTETDTMALRQEVVDYIRKAPGTSRTAMSTIFNLSAYRINRVFRQIGRDLSDEMLVSGEGYGVWIVPLDPKKCRGMVWMGVEEGGYKQCDCPTEFRDHCCSEHSAVEDPEMTAFRRQLSFLAGPCEPSAYGLSHLSIVVVEKLLAHLQTVEPSTKKETLSKEAMLEMLVAAVRHLRWKEVMRRLREGADIPAELWRRHRASSMNPFEFGLRKHFTTLEVTPKSTREEVLKAWKRLARICHPDTEGGGDEERMKLINIAKDRIFRIRRWE
ncbi:J domain-containing protein [Thermodesulfobacteriota bacterium]